MCISTCSKCKWQFKNKLVDKICGYCKVNKKLGINPVVIPQHKSDKRLDDLPDQEISLLIQHLSSRKR